MKPLGNHLLVEAIVVERAGPVYLTEKAKFNLLLSRPRLWKVLAVPDHETEIHVHDRLVSFSYSAGPTDLGDGKFLLPRDQVLARIERTAEVSTV